jgi:hypothetical protein
MGLRWGYGGVTMGLRWGYDGITVGLRRRGRAVRDAAPPLPRIISEKAAHPDEINRRIVADFGTESKHTLSMGSEPLKLQEKLAAEYDARWEAEETFKAQELAALTEERARQMIFSLGAVEAWRDRPDWSGPVEQQAIVQRGVAKGFAKATKPATCQRSGWANSLPCRPAVRRRAFGRSRP